MCGIHGILSFSGKAPKKLKQRINAMLIAAEHRGPDQSDAMTFSQGALGFGRLSIVAPNNRSTIHSIPGRNIFSLFNGEISNHHALRATMQHPPTERESDSAIILPLLQEHGQAFIDQLAGMFAIAVFDQDSNTLQLWRDPLGIKPLYYYESDECVIFSSELKAIYAAMESPPILDFAAVDHMLRFRFHPGRSTIFPEIKRVLPGETIRFDANGAHHRQYWTLGFNEAAPRDAISVEEFGKVFVDVVKEQAHADVPGGFFVSGGLDSSLITSIALDGNSPYTTGISIKFTPEPVVDEKYGELLERHLDTAFEWVEISDASARQALTELVSFLDEPLENPIHVGTYLMAKRANELGIKTVLTGDGSDEFFLGYGRHVCWFEQEPAQASESYPAWLWTMTPGEANELYKEEFLARRTPMVDVRGNPVEPFKDVEAALTFERLDRLPEYHCMRLDRMTMAWGVEAKVPFLDRRVVEQALRVPLGTLFGGAGKVFLGEFAKPWLPEQILHREKVHFPSLTDRWLSGEGAEWTAEILLAPSARILAWMKKDVLARYVREHATGEKKRGRLLWALLVLELWLRKLPSWRMNEFDQTHEHIGKKMLADV
jgi:asparagine synthase (glutamine-hydrolysing)